MARRARRRLERHTRMLFVFLALLVAIPLFVVSQASANHITLANPPSFTYVNDQQLADDQPGQKDLSAHASTCKTVAPCDLWVSWKWDITSLSGGNTGDACALFDTDGDLRVNSALCLTIAGSPANDSNTRVYTCGDDKVDRCTQPIALVLTIHSICDTTQPAGSDPFHSGQADTVAVCHVYLADLQVGTSTPDLVNTCSYPSQEPNSAPSDCVLIIRDAFIRIAKTASPNIGSFPFKLDGGSTPVFTASGTQTSSYLAISSKPNSHTVQELVPAGWNIVGTPSCTGASGAGSSNGSYQSASQTITGIIANSDNQITCSFSDQQQTATLNVTKTGSDSGSQDGAVFKLYTGFGTPQQAEFGSCTVSSGQCGSSPSFSNLIAGTTYTLDETTVPLGYTKDANLPKNFTPGAGDTLSFAAVNTAQPASVNVTKTGSDSGSQDGAVFTLYPGADTLGTAIGSCTVSGGQCGANPSFSGLAAGQYTIEETTVPNGYTKDATLPHTFTLSNGESANLAFSNTANPGSVDISKVDDHGDPIEGVTFQLYADNSGVKGAAISGKSCTTDSAGACSISSVTAGTYWVDETNLPAGYDKDNDLPEQIILANGGQITKSYTNDRLFKVITIVCLKVGDKLYPSSVAYDGGSASDSLAAGGLGTIDEGDLCGLGGAVHDDVKTGNHTSSIDIPASQP